MSKFAPPDRWIGMLLLAAMAAALTFAVFGHNGFMRLAELRRKRDQIRQENLRLQERNNDLQNQEELLRHNTLYLEKIVREELGLVAPNEIVFRFSQAPAHAAAEKTGPVKAPPPAP